jgi:hypothetical protein
VGKKEVKEEGKIINKIDMDNGYFPYAQDIGRVLAKSILTGSHRAILDCIFSKTFGYPDKKSGKTEKIKRRVIEEKITCRDFKDFTGIRRNHIPKYILELVNWKVIKRREKGQYYLYSFNVNVSQWNKGIFRESVTRIGDTLKSVTRIGDSSVTRIGDTLSQGLGTLAISKYSKKAISNKVLQGAPKSSNKLLKETYIKKEEKEDIYFDKNSREEREIFDYWNSLDIFEHKTFKFFKDDIKEALKNYSLEKIKNSIKNYSLILKGEEYYYSYEHMISSFLDPKNFEKFRDLEKAKKNYLRRGVNGETEAVEYERYKPEPVKKETEEERKVRYKESAKRIGDLKRELKERKNDKKGD